MAKAKDYAQELAPLTMEQRLKIVLRNAEVDVARLQHEYDRARQLFAEELSFGEGPTWVSSSSQHEWYRLRTDLWSARERLKALQFIAEAS